MRRTGDLYGFRKLAPHLASAERAICRGTNDAKLCESCVFRPLLIFLIAILLAGCHGSMMIASDGLEMDEHRAAREDKNSEKRINKLPPDEQAILRPWHVRARHSRRYLS